MPCAMCSNNWRLRKHRRECGSWRVFLLGREMSSARRHHRGRFLSQELQASLRDASRFPSFFPGAGSAGLLSNAPYGAKKSAIAFRRIRMNLVLTHTLKPSPNSHGLRRPFFQGAKFLSKSQKSRYHNATVLPHGRSVPAFESQTCGPTSRLVRSESEKRPDRGGRCRCFHDVRCRGQANELYGGKILPR